MNQKSSAGSPGHSPVQQKDEMKMKGELSDLTSCKKRQPSQHDFAGNLLESGLPPTCIPLPELEITHPSRGTFPATGITGSKARGRGAETRNCRCDECRDGDP